jgi:predicted RNase H-like HicB family nuclease
MKYRVAVEEVEPGHWVAWALDLPGCFSSASTEDEAVERAPERIAEYFTWLASHDATLPPLEGPFEVEVMETFRAFASNEDPRYSVNAFFKDDRRVVGYWDVEVALRLLVWTREDLLRAVEPLTRERLDEPVAGEVRGSIGGILEHVARAENWYFGHLDLGLDRAQLPGDPFEMLRVVRANTRGNLVRFVGEERITNRREELWSARKVVRRTLWHERDHTQHIGGLLATGC